MTGRISAGTTVASLPLIAAVPAFEADNHVLAWVFVGVFLVFALLTVAPWLPVLHLLPVFGARTPPTVSFHLEGQDGLRVDVKPDQPTEVILCVGLKNDSREEIARVNFNIWIDPLPTIRRCRQDGSEWPDAPGQMLTADCAYWAISRMVVGPDSTVMYFRATIPAPGTYRTVVKMWSPEFYGRDDRVFDGHILAQPAEPTE